MLVQRAALPNEYDRRASYPFRLEKSIPIDAWPSKPFDSRRDAPETHFEWQRCDERCCLRTFVPSLVLILCVVSLMLYSVLTVVDRRLGEARDAVRPYVSEVVNHTLSILQHVDRSTISANDMVDDARSVTSRAVPAMYVALNQTERLLQRVERLSQHPVLKLSLEQ